MHAAPALHPVLPSPLGTPMLPPMMSPMLPPMMPPPGPLSFAPSYPYAWSGPNSFLSPPVLPSMPPPLIWINNNPTFSSAPSYTQDAPIQSLAFPNDGPLQSIDFMRSDLTEQLSSLSQSRTREHSDEREQKLSLNAPWLDIKPLNLIIPEHDPMSGFSEPRRGRQPRPALPEHREYRSRYDDDRDSRSPSPRRKTPKQPRVHSKPKKNRTSGLVASAPQFLPIVCCNECKHNYIPDHNPARIFWHGNVKPGNPATPFEPGLCDVCGEDLHFVNPIHRDRHFPCYRCNASFKRSDRLLAHCSVHVLKKPFICKVCNAMYSRKNRLLDHMDDEHESTRTNTYVCTGCHKGFSHAASLRVHSRVCILMRLGSPTETL